MIIRSKDNAMARRSPISLESARDRVFSAALILFEARGYHGVAVPEIAVRAGLAIGSLYRVAPSKEALANQLFQTIQGTFNARVFAPFPANRTLRERFSLFWRRLSDWAVEEPIAARFLFLQQHTPYLDATSLALEQLWNDAVGGFAREGALTGQLKPFSPEVVSSLVWGPLAGLLRHRSATPEHFTALEGAIWDSLAQPFQPMS
jgi:AcrR family transcriptional regulator